MALPGPHSHRAWASLKSPPPGATFNPTLLAPPRRAPPRRRRTATDRCSAVGAPPPGAAMSASPDAALLDDLVIRFVLNVPAEELECALVGVGAAVPPGGARRAAPKRPSLRRPGLGPRLGAGCLVQAADRCRRPAARHCRSPERLMFVIEQAHWFYEARPDPGLEGWGWVGGRAGGRSRGRDGWGPGTGAGAPRVVDVRRPLPATLRTFAA